MAEYRTLSDMADEIGINYSTARNYVKRFQEYFTTFQVPGKRHPMYEPKALARLRVIADGYKANKELHEILADMIDRFGMVTDVVPSERQPGHDNGITTGLAQLKEMLELGQAGVDLALTTLKMYREISEAQGIENHRLRDKIAKLEAQLKDHPGAH